MDATAEHLNINMIRQQPERKPRQPRKPSKFPARRKPWVGKHCRLPNNRSPKPSPPLNSRRQPSRRRAKAATIVYETPRLARGVLLKPTPARLTFTGENVELGAQQKFQTSAGRPSLNARADPSARVKSPHLCACAAAASRPKLHGETDVGWLARRGDERRAGTDG